MTVVCWFVLGVAVCIVALSTPGLCYGFNVALVLFSRRYWLSDVAKGGENKGIIYHKT